MVRQWPFYVAATREQQKNRRLISLTKSLIRGITVTQLILASCLILAGGTVFAVAVLCSLKVHLYGAGLFVGIFCAITATFGLCSVTAVRCAQCLTVAYFLLTLICLPMSVLLSVASGFWLCDTWFNVVGKKSQSGPVPCGECISWDASTAFFMGTCTQMFLTGAYAILAIFEMVAVIFGWCRFGCRMNTNSVT